MIKRLGLCLALTISPVLWADPSSDLIHFFNHVGFAANVTAGHSYATQAAGYASMGSIFARNQVRTIQLAHVDVPGFNSGCAGIDITAGGFSFIKTDQVVKFMQNILSSGAGYALNLALETELPEIAHSMQFMQKLANDINSSNFNSCEMGETLGGALWPKNRAAHKQICEDLGTHTGVFSDWAMARQQCSTGGAMDEQLSKAKTNPEYKDRVLVNSNVVWDALQLNNFLSNDTKLAEVYMSISGTLVFNEKGALQSYPSLATNQDFIKALLYGGNLPCYTCDDAKGNCLKINVSGGQTIKTEQALVSQVQKILDQIYDHIKEGTALTTEQMGLIEMTQASVFELISANAQQNIGLQGSFELAQMVATDLLAQYLANALEVIRASLSGKELGSANEERLFKNLQVAQQFVAQFNMESRERFNTALKTNELVRHNVKQALSALNPMLRQAYNGAY